jgi:DNA polymerase III sliding clamp (beta) subunit (PCNA family)
MLNRHNFNIAKLVDDNASRFTLDGICVKNDRTEVATNHYLMTVSAPELDNDNFPSIPDFTPLNFHESFIISKDDALKISKAIPKKHTMPICQNAIIGSQTAENGHAYIGINDLNSKQIFQAKKIEGRFPDTSQVIPSQGKAKLTISFDSKLMAKLLNAMADAIDDKQPIVTFRFTDATSQVRIDAKNKETGQEIIGVIMPCNLK